jgi:hypothetical protein
MQSKLSIVTTVLTVSSGATNLKNKVEKIILNRRQIKDYSLWITETECQTREIINHGAINGGSAVHSRQN